MDVLVPSRRRSSRCASRAALVRSTGAPRARARRVGGVARCFAAGVGALAWGAAAGWDDRSFRATTSSAAAHGRAARRRVAAAGGRPGGRAGRLFYAGLAIGVALAVPIDPP
jgi:hypothetical protein